MADENLKEIIDVVDFAEKELKTILGEVNLQNERLINIQQKIGLTHSNLVRNSKLVNGILKSIRLKFVTGMVAFFIISIVFVCAKIILQK